MSIVNKIKNYMKKSELINSSKILREEKITIHFNVKTKY